MRTKKPPQNSEKRQNPVGENLMSLGSNRSLFHELWGILFFSNVVLSALVSAVLFYGVIVMVSAHPGVNPWLERFKK